MSQISRRSFLGLLAGAIAVGATHGVLGRAAELPKLEELFPILEPVEPKVLAVRELSQADMVAALKELYADYPMTDLVYRENPFLSLLKKDPFRGHWVPVPLVYGSA